MITKKLNSLQAGRGIAALMVVLYHANIKYGFGGNHFFGHMFSLGFAGVDFFFVLSGFIIAYTSYHFIGHKEKTISFIRKRFLRVYPIYWVYLMVVLAVCFLQYHDMHIFDNIWKTITLFPGHPHIIKTSWTLKFEIFFYALFAILIFSPWSLVIITLIAIISIINAVLQNTGTYGLFQNKQLNDLFSPFNIEFLFGILAFLIYPKINKSMIIILLICLLITMILEILFLTGLNFEDMAYGKRIIPFGLPAFAAVLTFAAVDHLNLLKTPRIFVMLGDASYTLYLIHLNLFIFISDTIFIPLKLSANWIMNLSIPVVIFTIWLSFMLYRYLEKPLLKKLGKAWPER